MRFKNGKWIHLPSARAQRSVIGRIANFPRRRPFIFEVVSRRIEASQLGIERMEEEGK